jgi:hypothetical protein
MILGALRVQGSRGSSGEAVLVLTAKFLKFDCSTGNTMTVKAVGEVMPEMANIGTTTSSKSQGAQEGVVSNVGVMVDICIRHMVRTVDRICLEGVVR